MPQIRCVRVSPHARAASGGPQALDGGGAWGRVAHLLLVLGLLRVGELSPRRAQRLAHLAEGEARVGLDDLRALLLAEDHVRAGRLLLLGRLLLRRLLGGRRLLRGLLRDGLLGRHEGQVDVGSGDIRLSNKPVSRKTRSTEGPSANVSKVASSSSAITTALVI